MEQGVEWAQYWPGRFGEKKNLFFLPGIKPWLIYTAAVSTSVGLCKRPNRYDVPRRI
jgi:hypothetical protein